MVYKLIQKVIQNYALLNPKRDVKDGLNVRKEVVQTLLTHSHTGSMYHFETALILFYPEEP